MTRDHAKASHALLEVMTQIEMQRARDVPLFQAEVQYARKLDALRRELLRPGHFQSRVAELASVVRVQQEDIQQQQQQMHGAGAGAGGSGAAQNFPRTLDDDTLKQLYEFLESQHLGTMDRRAGGLACVCGMCMRMHACMPCCLLLLSTSLSPF